MCNYYFYLIGIRFQAMTFHTNVGKNVSLNGSATVAVRHVDEFAQGQQVGLRYEVFSLLFVGEPFHLLTWW